MDQAEQVAKSVIEAVIQGAEMRYCQDQSAGQHDFDLVHQSGAVTAVEVTTAADEPRERTVAAIMHPRKGGPYIRTQRCQKKWLIRPLPSANINPIRAEADAYLAEIEAEGLERLFSPTDAASYPSVRRILNDLEVEGGGVLKFNPRGRIGISTPGGGGLVNTDHFQRAAGGGAIPSGSARAPLRLPPASARRSIQVAASRRTW